MHVRGPAQRLGIYDVSYFTCVVLRKGLLLHMLGPAQGLLMYECMLIVFFFTVLYSFTVGFCRNRMCAISYSQAR